MKLNLSVRRRKAAKSFLYHATSLSLLLLTASCAFIHDRSNDYVDARRESKLAVPDVYDKRGLRDDYPIPEIDQQLALARKFEVPPPPDAELEILADQYSIRRADQQVWLLINEEPGRVWPAMGRFWEENGLQMPYTSPKNGLMQTSVAGTNTRSRELLARIGLNPDAQYFFQARLDQGLKRRTTEVSVRLIQSGNPGGDLLGTWQHSSIQEASEEKLLSYAKEFLERDENNRSYSLLAQDITGSAKVQLQTEDDPPYLALNVSFERAWSSVGKALQDGKVPVADFNRSEGDYLVYFDPSDKSHFWLWGWLFSDNEEGLSDRYNYRVILENRDGAVRVRVESTEGKSNREREIQLLTRILDNIA